MGAGEVEAAAATSDLPYAPDRLIVRFREAFAEPPDGKTEGAVTEFGFGDASAAADLGAAGVSGLRRLLPWLDDGEVLGTNLEGDQIVLDDLASIYVAEVDSGIALDVALERVRSIPGVVYAHPDWKTTGYLEPTDQLYVTQQWGLHSTGSTVCGFQQLPVHIGAPAAWDRTQGSSATRIAILDTGIDPTHEDMGNRVDPGINFTPGPPDAWIDDHDGRHGTAVAGLAGARANNSAAGIVGVDWNARLVPVKVHDFTNGGYISWVIQGIDWTRQQKIPIVNMSLGTQPWTAPSPPDTIKALNDVCRQAMMSGQLLVAASGNVPRIFGEYVEQAVYPAAYHQRVLAVGASLPNGDRWRDEDVYQGTCQDPPIGTDCYASNFGPWLDVEAPGGRLVAAPWYSPSDYHELSSCSLFDLGSMGFSGTSAAAPLVSGTAGLLKAFRPQLTNEDIDQLLKLGGRFWSSPQIDRAYGPIRADFSLNLLVGKSITRWQVGTGLRSIGPLAVKDSDDVTVTFRNVPGLPSSNYTAACKRYRVAGTGNFGLEWAFTSTPRVWVRSVDTRGWRDTTFYDYDYELPFAKLRNLTAAGVACTTFTYRIKTLNPATTKVLYPVPPSEALVELTVIGTPVATAGVTDETSPGTPGVRIFPNPIAGRATVRLSLPEGGRAQVSIMDVTGRTIETLLDASMDAGEHELKWNGRLSDGGHAPPGVYFVRARVPLGVSTKRFVLLSAVR